MSQRDESGLIREFRSSRDAKVFDRIYEHHNPSLYATAVRITGDVTMAADATQDAWIRSIEQIDRFEEKSSFRTWVTGILVNCIREAWRRERRNPFAEDINLTVNGMPPLPHGIEPIDLENAIASLPGGFREVLILHDIEGFSHEEIAAMLGVVPGTSKSQLARARQRMRERLNEDSMEVRT